MVDPHLTGHSKKVYHHEFIVTWNKKAKIESREINYPCTSGAFPCSPGVLDTTRRILWNSVSEVLDVKNLKVLPMVSCRGTKSSK